MKFEKGTIGWLREQQKIKAKKDGFDNVDDWLKWRADPFNILEKRYGREFADWTRQNKDRVPKWYIDSGCKTTTEYLNKCAKDAGFKDRQERYGDYKREWTYKTGRYLPKGFDEDGQIWFGEFTENLMIQTFEGAVKMPPNNPGYDWTCKKGDKIDNKCRCLSYGNKSPNWLFPIRHNNIADWFILSAWDDRDSLNPLHVWAFYKNDIVRGRKFCEFETFSITNTPKKLKELEKYEITNRLEKLKELCNKERKNG